MKCDLVGTTFIVLIASTMREDLVDVKQLAEPGQLALPANKQLPMAIAYWCCKLLTKLVKLPSARLCMQCMMQQAMIGSFTYSTCAQKGRSPEAINSFSAFIRISTRCSNRSKSNLEKLFIASGDSMNVRMLSESSSRATDVINETALA